MNCLSLTRKRPARGKTKKADSTIITWTKEWKEKGQLPSMGESGLGPIEAQYEEHNVITGRPDISMPMVTNRMIYFLLRFKIDNPLCDSVPISL